MMASSSVDVEVRPFWPTFQLGRLLGWLGYPRAGLWLGRLGARWRIGSGRWRTFREERPGG